jgi:hypothetical protein
MYYLSLLPSSSAISKQISLIAIYRWRQILLTRDAKQLLKGIENVRTFGLMENYGRF